jgi:hypothetical protein
MDDLSPPAASQVRSILESELQDQTVVEIQTAQKVVARVSEWAKLFAFFGGMAICRQLREKIGQALFGTLLFEAQQDIGSAEYPLEFTAPFAKQLIQRLGFELGGLVIFGAQSRYRSIKGGQVAKGASRHGSC